MQITVKTLKQEAFQVEVEESDKVLTIKEKIEKSHGHPVASQKLIFSGKCKILVDENPVSQYNITEKDFLVVMVAKPKAGASASKPAAAASSSAPAATPVAAPAAAPATPAAPAAPAVTPAAPVTQTPAEQTPAAPATAPINAENPTPAATAEPTSGDSALLTGSNFELAIQGMIEMGFPREQCIRAMRASFNNPDRAVEYLFNGIPEGLQAQASAPAPTPRASQPAAAAAPTTAPSSTAAAPAAAAQPQNLFTAAAQAAAESRRANTGAGGPGNAESLSFLRDQPQFQQIREMVQQNPDLLQPLLMQLGQSNPQMLQLINQNQQAFLDLLTEGGEGEEGTAPSDSNVIYVTAEEQEAIQRIENLGFSRRAALEAYFACDRDEQLAVNYLFEAGNDDDEDLQ
ncbi:hypothetical protein BGZ94_002518 [Podila epigama]|nr:hypothetical protein BGZ94_002518 [Podila epigama]